VIDVMMPFYGDASLMRAAVGSVISQTSSDWRLTVVDDCDPDPAAGSWLRGLAHPQVTYLRNDTRLGVSGNFRRCLELASAPYVTFMGCDDLMGREYVAAVLEAVQAVPGIAAVQPQVHVIDQAGEPSHGLTDRVKRQLAPKVDEPLVVGGESLATSLLHGNWMYFPAVCWDRTVVSAHSFRDDMETVLDLDLILSLVLAGRELMLLPQPAFSYRRHRRSASSLSANSAARFAEESRLFDEAARRSSELGWSRAARAARWHLTSRLHAALLVPPAVLRGDRPATRALIRHALGHATH
jgi:glycosyltransferase involved in cell wall biosynthesis